MRISLVQYAPIWEDRQASRERLKVLLADVPTTDWLVLPEMSLSGFTMRTEASTWDGSDFGFFSDLAREHSCWVTSGGAQDGQNKAFAFDPEGRIIASYAKRHLFSHSGEEAGYIPGAIQTSYRVGTNRVGPNRVGPNKEGANRESASQVIGDSGMQVGQAICYDLRFPYHFWTDAPTVDAFCVIAAWGKGRADQWRALLKARAIENQAFMIGVNRVGSEPAAVYSGDSSVFGPRGEELLYCGDAEGVFSVEIEPSAARKWREAFPVIKDRLE
jgi:predicted amidohydrolase